MQTCTGGDHAAGTCAVCRGLISAAGVVLAEKVYFLTPGCGWGHQSADRGYPLFRDRVHPHPEEIFATREEAQEAARANGAERIRTASVPPLARVA